MIERAHNKQAGFLNVVKASVLFLVILGIALGILLYSARTELNDQNRLFSSSQTTLKNLQSEIRSREAEIREYTFQNAKQATADSQKGQKAEKFVDRLGSALKVQDFRELMKREQETYVQSHYRELFVALRLSKEQAAQLVDILCRKQMAKTDALIAAKASGGEASYGRNSARTKMIIEAQKPCEDEISAMLGADGYAKYQAYEVAMPVRDTVNQISRRLSYTSTPLTQDQAERLVQSWVQLLPISMRSSTGVSAEVAAGLLPESKKMTIPNGAVDAAKSILNEAQAKAVEELYRMTVAEKETAASLGL